MTNVGDEELDDEEDPEEEEEEDASNEEEEICLKYQRMGGSVPRLLSADAASCLTVVERIIALGTHDGNVYLLDYLGNEVRVFALIIIAKNLSKVFGRRILSKCQ